MESFILVELTLVVNGDIIHYIVMGILVIVGKPAVLRPTLVALH